MKRLYLFFALVSSLVILDDALLKAEAKPRLIPNVVDTIGPAKTSLTLNISTGTYVTITAPTGVGVRNCLTHLIVSPQKTAALASYTINILDAGTTTYTINLSTGAYLNMTWPETNAWCGGPKKATYITGTSLAPIASNVAVDVSYQGFTQ